MLENTKRKIVIVIIILLILSGLYYLYLKYDSMSNWNVLPRKYMDEYLTAVYGDEFIFVSQNYHYATDYHIWTLTYKDKNETIFNHYYYIDTPENLKWFSNVKDYGIVWDTYAASIINAEFEDMYQEISYDRRIIPPEEGLPWSHFNLQINNEEELKRTSKYLSAIYQRLYEITETPKGISLVCDIFRDDELIAIVDPNKISEDIGSSLDEKAFYEYLKSSISYHEKITPKTWCGNYEFSEQFNAENGLMMVMEYAINIYKKDNQYLADIEIVGQNTWIHVQADVFGNAEWISFRFLREMENNMTKIDHSETGTLFNLKRADNQIYTDWEDIQPMLKENQASWSICFNKID